MARKYDRYELEIIISLGALILFLISINFISGYSFERAVRGQAVQFENSVNIAANFIKNELEDDLQILERSDILLLERLKDLSAITGIDELAVVDSSDKTLVSLAPRKSGETQEHRLTVKLPLKGRSGRIRTFLVVSSVNRTGLTYKSLARWDTVFRIVGVLSALVIAFFFLRAVLHPYRRIKREALDYNLDLKQAKTPMGIEYVVDTFREVIEELEEKKARLETMYDSSEKRAESLARYNDYILGSISSGVVICDSSGIVTRFNPSAEEILRHFESDCRGKHYREIFGEEHRLSVLLDDALLRGITHSRKEFEIRRPDGERLWLGCSSSMINDENGEGMGAVLLMIDLTEIRRLQELSAYSEKMASLGETAAGLAHEIRNSFAAILGLARLLGKKGLLSDKDSKLIEGIIAESGSAEALLSRFLNFARPLDYVPRKLDLRALIASAVNGISHPGLERIKVENSAEGGVGEIEGDPILLKQAISNLLLNACDAMPDGGEIHVETRRIVHKSGRSEISISVADSGQGIDPRNIERIFEPFYTDKPDGTGLGLAVVKKIIVQHQGRIEVKSKPGKGTRFVIHLPDIQRMPEIPKSKKPDTKTPAHGRTMS